MTEQNLTILGITRQELTELIKKSVLEIKDELVSNEDDLLTRQQAAKLFCPAISIQTITNWTKAGKLEAVRKGGRDYYSRKELMSKSNALKKFKI